MRLLFFSFNLLFVVMVGCAIDGESAPSRDHQPQQRSKTAAVADHSDLVQRLRAAGAEPVSGDRVEQPFLSITGTLIKVHGEDVQVFQYANASAADAAAAPISRDGMAVGTRKIFWVGPPHFFKQGRLLVLYVGDNDKVLKALEAVLGRQFAGQ